MVVVPPTTFALSSTKLVQQLDIYKVTCYFIFMLTQRTNVLLTPIEHNVLMRLSQKEGKTMGQLIRHAVRKTYKIKSQEDSLEKTLAHIRKLTKNINTKGIDYRALVTKGRKYE